MERHKRNTRRHRLGIALAVSQRFHAAEVKEM